MSPIRFTIALIFALSATQLHAQSKSAGGSGISLQYYEQGKKANEDGKYAEAITALKKAVSMAKDYEDAWNLLGTAYQNNRNYAEAIEAFTQLEKVNPNYWPWYLYQMAQCHEGLNHTDEAVRLYTLFQEKYSKAPDRTIFHHQAKFRIAYVKGRAELLKMPNTMKDPENLGAIVNSSSDDYFPQIDPTGTKLYFTSQRQSRLSANTTTDGNYGEDVYYVQRAGNTWAPPTLLPEPINSRNNDGAATFSGDGQVMVYGQCSTEESIGSCDLYISTLDGDQWSAPVNLGNVVNSKDWDAQANLSADGTKILFSSDRPGGYGGEDIYMVEKNQFGDWGVAQNLGPIINTPYNDKSPYLAPDGRTLYFSSSGHPGFGGFDLFKSTFENMKWTNPVNLGRPLNSEGDDNYFTISASGEHAYFASTRAGGSGMTDLYQIEIPEALRPQPTVVITGVVTNAKTGQKISAWVLVEDIVTGDMIATNKSNSNTGEYLIVLPAGRNYSVSANRDGFFFYSQNFDVPDDAKYQELKKNIELKPIEKGTKVVLNNIFFESGKAELKPESYLELAKAIELMKVNTSMRVEVGGHTDNVGADDKNMALSHARAKAVMDFMVKGGIAVGRLMAKGYGETQPVATNDTDEGRQANRRTEFVIIDF